MKDHPSQWIQSGLTCRDVTTRASQYLDNRLPILTNLRVGLHIATCAHCRTYMKQIDLMRETLACFPKQALSPINRLRLRQHFVASPSR